MSISPVQVGIGLGLGMAAAGVAGAMATRPWIANVFQHREEREYTQVDAKIAADAKAHNGKGTYPFVTTTQHDEADGYADAGSVELPGIGGIVLGGFGIAGVFKTGSPKLRLAAAGVALLGAGVLGAAVGGVLGASQGAKRVHVQHTIAIDDQVSEDFQNFDRDHDGKLSLTVDHVHPPEDTRAVPGSEDENGQPYFASMHTDMAKADTNHDKVVTRDELGAYLKSIDRNGDGRISYPEVYHQLNIDMRHGDYDTWTTVLDQVG